MLFQKKNSFIGPEFVHSTYTPIGQAGDVGILKNNFFLPLGFTYERYIAFKDFTKLERLQKHITLFNAFVIDEVNQQILMHFSRYNTDETPTGSYDIEKYKNDVGARKRNYLKISEHSQNHIKGTITLEKIEMLFFSIPYDQGWTAVVDGKKETPLLVNIGFMGIIVEAGTHTVELRYRVPYFKTGLIVSVLSVFIYVLFVLSRPWRLRKGKATRND